MTIIPHLWTYLTPTALVPQIAIARLERAGYTITRGPKWIYAGHVDQSPILLVAHYDTVHDRQPRHSDMIVIDGVLSAPGIGIGADDRAGIAGIFEVIARGHRPQILLLDEEETGCLGARDCVNQLDLSDQDIRYAIELDRHGREDAVFYDCDNPEFTGYIEGFGFVEAIGSFSDISVLCPAYGFAGANLSIGYYREHNAKLEHLIVSEWRQTIDRVCVMLDHPPVDRFEYMERERIPWKQSYENYDSRWTDYQTTNQHDDYSECYDLQIDAQSMRDLAGGTYADWELILSVYGEDIRRDAENALSDIAVNYLLKLYQSGKQ